MKAGEIVHFVYFETTLNSNQFIHKWERFLWPANSNPDVTMQVCADNASYKYIAEHRCNADEFKFVFTKAAKSTRAKETEIKTVHLGGYSIIQEENNGNARNDESKIFIFLKYADIDFYKQLKFSGKLNIYQAYFENCVYNYILEYFISNEQVDQLRQKLYIHNTTQMNVYTEFPGSIIK